jgi:gliding motility-associated-like protein
LNPPTAQITASPLTGYAPLPVSFTNGSSNGTSYIWDLGNNTNITVPDLAGQSTVYATPGTYTAYVVAVNGNCNDTAFVTIIVDEYIPPVIVPVAIEFPNVITPNNDQVNDVFGPTSALNIASLEITILNRWGITVFKSSTSLWDGKIDGKAASEGVYFYTYKAIGAQNEVLEGHGQVTLTK